MDDFISRKEAVDALGNAGLINYAATGSSNGLIHAMNVIKALPAQPQRMRGRWIDAEWENINTGEKRKGRRCSVCKCGYFRYDVSVNTVSDIPNFCPNCGADMREGQDG